MSFTAEELAYLDTCRVVRLATVGPDGRPDLVPLAFEFDGTHFWVGGIGESVLHTRKFQNVESGNHHVALLFDDMPSVTPLIARGIRVYGEAEGPIERTGMIGPGFYLRITPTTSWSWNLEGRPAGETWYPTTRTTH
ncbi:PPOX class F420-dependent oxidoreductase [Spirillospora sp. CA-294931]|uniref:PPOX class F420-dependent oxidoreductase n=1 Tax=Spirillospora sp. CA-294931 TaxID=3240042 RepID=UPI003D8B1505